MCLLWFLLLFCCFVNLTLQMFEAKLPKIHDTDDSIEYQLHNALLNSNRYSKNVRPVINHNKPVYVQLGMCVMMIEDLVERDQTMIMSACVKMFWTDEYLRWNPDRFGNVTWLALDSSLIWLPDIVNFILVLYLLLMFYFLKTRPLSIVRNHMP